MTSLPRGAPPVGIMAAMLDFPKIVTSILIACALAAPATLTGCASRISPDVEGESAIASETFVEAPPEARPAESTEAPEAAENPYPGTGQVYLVVAPNLSWEDISNESTPVLQHLVGNGAVANVITERKIDVIRLVDNPRMHYMRLNDASASVTESYVAGIYGNLKENDSLIVTSSPSLAKIDTYRLDGYGLLIMMDGSDNGLISSLTVRRSGLITSGNLGDAIDQLLLEKQRNPANLSIAPFTSSYGALQRADMLSRNDSIAVSVKESKDGFISMFIALLGVTLVLSMGLISLDIHIRPRFLAYLLPITRILWIGMLSIPLATFIMHLQLPSFTTAEITFDFFLFVAMEISFVCIIVALVFRWTYSLLLILALTTLTLLVDQLLGGPMTVCGYLSYSPIETTRYYGIGNEGASLAFSSWIMFSGLVLNRFANMGAARHFRRWIFPVGCAAVVTILAAPWWGCNFGTLIWGTVGSIVAWWLFNGMRVTWKHMAVFVLVALALTIGVLFLDSAFNDESHLGVTADSLTGGWHLVAFRIIADMLRLSWNTILFSPILAAIFVAIVAFMIYLRWRKPGQYRTFWDENCPFTAAYTALVATALIMLLIEDSGILMPALVLLYETAGLLWLVCDRHSWHIRSFTRRKMNLDFEQMDHRAHSADIDKNQMSLGF